MARESFADAATAALMNRHFVNVKVDREERPDVDAIYIRALQAMGRRAGWPLTMFLTPQGKSFWGGTYFPPEQSGGLPAFREVLEHVSEIYRSDPQGVEEKARRVMSEFLQRGTACCGDPIAPQSIGKAAEDLLTQIDPVNGGLRGAPKFPYPALLRFLWNAGKRTGRTDFCNAVRLTADRMLDGGIYDHVNGGFFRYAVDAAWQVPHFEKMLYDNAQQVHLLTELWRSTAQPNYLDAIERSVEWLIGDMTLADGAFASSLDAESGGKEGAFYVWTDDQLREVLGERAAFFTQHHGVSGVGDFSYGHVIRRAA